MLERFRAMIDVVNEQHVPAIQLKTLPYFDQLGVADTGIISLCGAETLVMTVDLDLYLSVEAVGLPAINFNHLIDLEG